MYFQIKEIVLWPKNRVYKPRRLSFENGKVNIISGTSRTGKSAIIPIIDYCLGSGKCRIPVKTIRDACDWFGVVIQTSIDQKLYARREPGSLKATGDMFISEGKSIEIPDHIESKNTTVESVKRSLGDIAGLTDLDFDIEGTGSGFKERPSFRDMGAFIFQPQNLVANPDVLFYKTETYQHREKLRTIFPYVLNAINPELMAKQHELTELRRLLRRKEQEIATVRQVSDRWIAEIRTKVSRAMELGLIRSSISETTSRKELVDLLRKVVHTSTDKIRVTTHTVNEAVQELVSLNEEETQVSMDLSSSRRRFLDMTALRESTIHYKGALHIQRDRLKISEWLRNTHQKDHDCPLCGGSLSQSTETLDNLYHALQSVEEAAGHFDAVPAAFDREYNRVKSEIRTLTDKLRGIQVRIKSLEQRSKEARQRHYDSLQTSRFIGNIEESLQTYARLGKDSELNSEIMELRERVNILTKEISNASIQAKTKRALNVIASNVGKILPYLDLERPNDPISLLIDDLTIKVSSIEREDFLWEIGSGSNWLSYHIAVTLGLQQFFLDLSHSPVPSFIVYDQPSQVYFPKKLVVRDEEEDFDPEYKDEDIEAVKKAFSVMASVVQRNKGNLQIIVLDHASENVWGNIDNVHCVEEWREGNKLIPISWLNDK